MHHIKYFYRTVGTQTSAVTKSKLTLCPHQHFATRKLPDNEKYNTAGNQNNEPDGEKYCSYRSLVNWFGREYYSQIN